MEKLEKATKLTRQAKLDRPFALPGTEILLGTSAFNTVRG